MNKGFRLLALLFALSLSLPGQAAVSAWLERDHVQPGDTVQLSLKREGRGGGDPDLSPLQQDFDIVGTSSNTSVRVINGDMVAQRRLYVTLSPKRSGQLTIPAITWDGEASAPLAVTVDSSGGSGKEASAGSAGTGTVFLESELDPPTPYVQQATRLTVRLYAAEPLYQASLDLPQWPDVLLQQVGKDVQGVRTIKGREYQMVERQYLLFPQRSGAQKLDGPVLNAQVAGRMDPFGGNGLFAPIVGATRALRLHGDPLSLDVRPRPESATQGDWLPARRVSLSEQWTPEDGAEIHVGDPLTRRLVLQAEGLTAGQLPDLGARAAAGEGVKAYPDQAALETRQDEQGVIGERRQSIAYIADRAGDFSLPAVKVSWWDIEAKQARVVELPARRIHVLPAVGAQAVPPSQAVSPPAVAGGNVAVAAAPLLPSAGASGTGPWPWVAAACALGWLATALGWWWQRRGAVAIAAPAVAGGKPEDGRGKGGLKPCLEACRANDARAARQALLAWYAAAHAPEGAVNLGAMGRHFGDEALQQSLRELDRACYGGGVWQGTALAEQLARLSSPPAARPATGALPALYA